MSVEYLEFSHYVKFDKHNLQVNTALLLAI